MRINTNLTAMNTYTQYTKNNNKIASAVEKLSSGYSINSASDNAAGLAISEKMRAQIRGLEKASVNSQDAISLVQTAEGALAESTEILQRMRELAVQSASDTNEDAIDRAALQDEFAQLQAELNDISKNTSFNKKTLLDGSLSHQKSKLSNVSMAQSGLSVELGRAAAGNYNFSVNVQQESAAIDGSAALFTPISSSDAFTVNNAVDKLGESSLANGNYAIKVHYDTANKQMIFTATGDNNHVFEAILSEADLAEKFGGATPTAATLNFSNGSSAAFSFDLKTSSSYDTTSSSTMSTLANDLSESLSLSASGGVDAKDATYGVYASLTGAGNVKLEAGMDSVTFSNGIKVNFDELTTSDISSKNAAALEGGVTLTGVDTASASTGTYTTGLANFKALDTYSGSFGDVDDTLTAVVTDFSAGTMKVTIDSKVYTASFTESSIKAALGFEADDAVGAEKSYSLVFKDEDGTSAFTMDAQTKLTALNSKGTPDGESALTADALGASGLTVKLTNGGGHTYDATFGTHVSTFGVVGATGAGLTFQVGANQGDDMTIYINKMDANYLGVSSSGVGTQSAASAAIGAVDSAINQVSSQRAYLGAVQNRLDHKIANLDTSAENLTSAESLIRDVDMAKEMTNFTNSNILQQAATAMLAQANSLPQNVLSLIG